MCDEIDAFDFVLAQDLSMSLGQVRALSNAEVVEWQAFYKYRLAMEDFHRREAENRRGR